MKMSRKGAEALSVIEVSFHAETNLFVLAGALLGMLQTQGVGWRKFLLERIFVSRYGARTQR